MVLESMFVKVTLKLKYRYRLRKYIVHVPYSLIQGPQVVKIKDKIFPLNYQNGLRFLIEPAALGYDAVNNYEADD